MDDNPNRTPFRDALFAALTELATLKEQERIIALRKAQLQLSINALSPLAFEQPAEDINELSLPRALRIIMRSAGRALNAHDFRTKLTDLGFDLSKFSNPMANIQTAMNRLVEGGEFMWEEDGSKKVLPGQELKSEPDPPEIDTDTLKGLLQGLSSTTFDPSKDNT
jgi:hypothetical protein